VLEEERAWLPINNEPLRTHHSHLTIHNYYDHSLSIAAQERAWLESTMEEVLKSRCGSC